MQYLSGTGSNNLRFQDIDIQAGTLASGQTLALNAIGTATTANLRYVFPGNFTVSSGATLTVGPNVSVLIQENLTLTDNGTLSFATGDTVTLTHYGTTQIVVGSGGLLHRQRHRLQRLDQLRTTQIVVNSGGHLQASNSTFALNHVTLNIGSVLNAGDLAGNSFNLPLYPARHRRAVPVRHWQQQRSVPGHRHPAGHLTSGQTLALNAIGTATTANLRYVFPGNFTVSSGATVTVGPNVRVLIQENLTLTDNGTLSFATGDTVALTHYGTTQIVVGSGGLLHRQRRQLQRLDQLRPPRSSSTPAATSRPATAPSPSTT